LAESGGGLNSVIHEMRGGDVPPVHPWSITPSTADRILRSGQQFSGRNDAPSHRRPHAVNVAPGQFFIPDFFVTCDLALFRSRFLGSGAGVRERDMSAFHDIMLVVALIIAGALTAAWDGLLSYGLFKLMSTAF
jgi:hypothetical protein